MIRGGTVPFLSASATPRSRFKPSSNTLRITPSTESWLSAISRQWLRHWPAELWGYPAIQSRLLGLVATNSRQGNCFKRQVCLFLDSPLTRLIQTEAESPGRFVIRAY